MTVAAEPVCLNLNIPSRGAAVPFFHYPASQAHILGIFEGRTYPILPDIGPVSTIVDIGANVGAASVMLAEHYPQAVIHAFEPGPATAALLARNAAPFPHIRVYAHGLGREDGQLRLFRSRWDPMSASVLQSAENGDTFDVVEIRQATAALAACGIAAIDLLKIDTEGCELPILTDLAALAGAAKVIYLEFHSERDRLRIDQRLSATHVLAFAAVRHPHRGDVCYVHRDTPFAHRHAPLAIEPAD